MGKGTPSLSHALVCPGVTQVMDAVLSRLACPQHDLLLLYYPGQQKVVCVIKSVEHRTVSVGTMEHITNVGNISMCYGTYCIYICPRYQPMERHSQ